MKLTHDEKELLSFVVREERGRALMKVLEGIAAEMGEKVLSFDVRGGTDRDLSLIKAESDGALRLIRNFSQVVNTLKAKQES